MFIPLSILVPGIMLAAFAILVLVSLLHMTMRDAGRCIIGRRDLYLENHVLEQRWCILYVIVHVRTAAHSYSSL